MPKLAEQTLSPLWELKKQKGIDNVTNDDLRLASGFVRAADNLDIDSEAMAHRRKGVIEELLNGSWHSLWSDEGNLCFGVRNRNLVQLFTDWTVETLLNDVGSSEMHFVKAVDRVFFSNRLVVGYFLVLDGQVHAFPESTRSLRQKMMGAELIEYFNGRLYAVQDGVIFYSIAYSPMEIALNANFQPIGGPVTMFHAVEDGIYASGAGKTFFLNYDGENDLGLPKFQYKSILDVPTRKGSPQVIEKLDFGKEVGSSIRKVAGKAVVFATNLGIYIGFKGGHVLDCTSDHYAVRDVEEGSSAVRWQNGYRQYLFVGQTPPGGVFGTTLPILTGSFMGTVPTPAGVFGRLPMLRGLFEQ